MAFIALDRNRGFAAGNNAGIRATRGELLLLLNSDTVVPAGAIDTLIARLLAHPSAAAAGPRLIDRSGRAELSFGPIISPLGELRQKAIGALYDRGIAPIAGWVERQTRREQYVDWVSGACLLVSRADAESVGLLDERFFLYTEDVDFCAALRARGRRILFAPASEVTHLRGRSRASARLARTRPTGAARSRSTRSIIRAGPRLLRAYLRLKGALPDKISTPCA